MIVRHDGDGLLCISQPDHAALAATLMAAWRADGFPDRPTRDRVLTATRQHDLGWTEEDAVPRLNPDTGAPYDFVSAPVEVRQRLWPRAVDRLAAEDPYVAALVAQHALTVYRRFQRDPAWRGFFPALEARRDDLFADLMARPAAAGAGAAGTPANADLTSFLQDYTIVGLGDLLSLVFCNAWPEPYLMEGYRAILRDDCLTVAPDPFEGATVDLSVPARRLPAQRYGSQEALAEAWANSTVVTLFGRAVGAPAGSP